MQRRLPPRDHACATVAPMSAQRHVLADTVPAHRAGERLDRVAAECFGQFSRMQLAAWIRCGALRLDHAPAKPAQRVAGGEALTLDAPVERRVGDLEPERVPFAVVHEDAHVLVVDKPAGVVVHPGAGVAGGTLVNGLLAHRPALAALPRAGLVHRLDKETSGLMLVAASSPALPALTRAMAGRAIGREYLAVTEGALTGGRRVDLPIGRDPARRTRQRVRADGRPAASVVRVEQRYRAHTAVHVTLETGRTHQVRVHMSAIGHPLVGDHRYGARGRLPKAPTDALLQAVRRFRRQALHARRLSFAHPITGAAMSFSSPIPADIASLLEALADDAAGAA